MVGVGLVRAVLIWPRNETDSLSDRIFSRHMQYTYHQPIVTRMKIRVVKRDNFHLLLIEQIKLMNNKKNNSIIVNLFYSICFL